MIGKTVSHYRILEKLGAGGMGVVYKAEDLKLNRTVALKFLPSQLLRSEGEKARFVHEAQAVAALDHPNICTIHEIDTADDETFIAMAYVPGESLEKRIAKGPLPLDEAVRIAVEMCDALHESHSAGIVHRDIKPANIIISEKGHAVLMDFGLAKIKGRTKLTQEGAAVGTFSYMSPEQTRGADVDRRTDIWSLGVVLYEMITGQPPFKADHELAVAYSIVNEEPAPPTALRTGVPMELEQVVRKALAKHPDERYQHVDDMRVDLKRVETSRSSAQHPGSRPAQPVRRKPGFRHAAGLALIVIAIAAAVWLWPRKVDMDTGRAPALSPGRAGLPLASRQNSIAVLPLDNLSGDEGNAFFVDGMTEEITTQLAQIKALKVISRTSAMRYRDTEKPLTEVAGDLGVATILEGSVLWADGRVRISVQLIDGVEDRLIWGNSYESDLSDVLGLQRRVANEVAGHVKVELTPEEKDRLASAPVVDPEVYELYLKGRFHWNKRTVEGIGTAIDFYQQAIEKDPRYALAYAGLAECYAVLGTWAHRTPTRDLYPKAREFAERALGIDPDLVAAHAVLGIIANEYDWDWEKAETHYRRAIELNPNYASARQWYGEFLTAQGRHDEAIREIKTARELDPLSLIIASVAGYIDACGGHYEQALAEFRKISDIDPNFPALFNALAYTYTAMGDRERAAGAMVRYLESTAGDESERRDIREAKTAYERGGADGFCRAAVALSKRQYSESYFAPVHIAEYFAQLGEPDSAIVWLEKGYRERSAAMCSIADVPTLRPLHSDQRFVDLLVRMRLPHTAPVNPND